MANFSPKPRRTQKGKSAKPRRVGGSTFRRLSSRVESSERKSERRFGSDHRSEGSSEGRPERRSEGSSEGKPERRYDKPRYDKPRYDKPRYEGTDGSEGRSDTGSESQPKRRFEGRFKEGAEFKGRSEGKPEPRFDKPRYDKPHFDKPRYDRSFDPRSEGRSDAGAEGKPKRRYDGSSQEGASQDSRSQDFYSAGKPERSFEGRFKESSGFKGRSEGKPERRYGGGSYSGGSEGRPKRRFEGGSNGGGSYGARSQDGSSEGGKPERRYGGGSYSGGSEGRPKRRFEGGSNGSGSYGARSQDAGSEAGKPERRFEGRFKDESGFKGRSDGKPERRFQDRSEGRSDRTFRDRRSAGTDRPDRPSRERFSPDRYSSNLDRPFNPDRARDDRREPHPSMPTADGPVLKNTGGSSWLGEPPSPAVNRGILNDPEALDLDLETEPGILAEQTLESQELEHFETFEQDSDEIDPDDLDGDYDRLTSNTEVDSALIYGRHAVLAALDQKRTLNRIWVTAQVRYMPRFHQLLDEAAREGTLIDEVSPQRLNFMTEGARHQGIAAQGSPYNYLDLQELVDLALAAHTSPVLIMADGIQDPHNLGAIARTAEALGMQGLIIPQRRAVAVTAVVVKVAAGALSHFPVARVVNLNRSLEYLKERGFWVYGTLPGSQESLASVQFQGPTVVVVGSEGDGISLLTQRHCDVMVSIPLVGKTSSLNASVATAIVLYEITRQRNAKTLDLYKGQRST